MGGTSSSSQSQSSSLTPYSAATPTLNGLLGQVGNLSGSAGSLSPVQSGAINQIEANSNGMPNYSAPINSGTYGLLNGGGATQYNPEISNNLGMLQNGIVGKTASGSNIGANNPAFTTELNVAGNNAANTVNSEWAAAGRGGSPGQGAALGTAITNAEAPIIQGQYNTDTTNALNAAGTLYGAGNTTYGMLGGNNQTGNANFVNGIGTVGAGLNAENAAPNATLQAAADQFGIPASQLRTLLGMVSPVAAQFGTQNGTANGSQTMSGAQQFGIISNALSSWMPWTHGGSVSFGS